MQTHELLVDDGLHMRLDAYLASRLQGISRSAIQRLIDSSRVLVNSTVQRSNYKVQRGDIVKVEIPPAEPTDLAAEEIPLEIVYEDESLLVINKPKGMTVYPAPGSPHGTLVNAVLAHCKSLSGVGGVERPGIVHRLDKDTSGLLVVAKNDHAHIRLQEQIQKRTAVRRYLALVWGAAKFEEAVVDAPIGRHPTDRKKMSVIRDTDRYTARKAVTHLKVVERFDFFTLFEARLETGRTHQIRIHCSFAGHPVVGDPTYGGTKRAIPVEISKSDQRDLARLMDSLHGQALHAFSLSFDHPVTGERLTFETPLPDDYEALVVWLRARKST